MPRHAPGPKVRHGQGKSPLCRTRPAVSPAAGGRGGRLRNLDGDGGVGRRGPPGCGVAGGGRLGVADDLHRSAEVAGPVRCGDGPKRGQGSSRGQAEHHDDTAEPVPDGGPCRPGRGGRRLEGRRWPERCQRGGHEIRLPSSLLSLRSQSPGYGVHWQELCGPIPVGQQALADLAAVISGSASALATARSTRITQPLPGGRRQRGGVEPRLDACRASGLLPCPSPGCSPERCHPHRSHRWSSPVEAKDPRFTVPFDWM
jgi:hypothetical protein